MSATRGSPRADSGINLPLHRTPSPLFDPLKLDRDVAGPSLSRSGQLENLAKTIPRKNLERGPGAPTGRYILQRFGHEDKSAFISFEGVLVYKSFHVEISRHILRSGLVKADQSKLFMHLAGWVGLLGHDLDKLICQGQRIGLLYRTHARFSRAAAAPIPNS